MKSITRTLFLTGLLFLSLGALALSGCSDNDSAPEPPSARVVTVAWLMEHLEDPEVVIVDTRPTHEYLAGHIPGAVSASFDEVSSTSRGVYVSYGGGIDLFLDRYRAIPFQDGDAGQIEDAVRALGIDRGSLVVAYDAGAHFHATRFAFTLDNHGFDRVLVLDGGLGKWQADGGALDTAVPTVEPGDFVAREPTGEMVATTDDVLRAQVDPNVKIVTALWPTWHYGKYLAYSKPGHIPGAIPIPMPYLFDSDGTFREPAQIQALLEVSGIDEDDEIITYCGGNPLSACAQFAFQHILGRDKVRVYEAALIDWLADPRDLPIHTYQHPELLRDTDWIHWWAGERMQTLLMDAPAMVIDPRPATDYEVGHIPFAVSLPPSDPTTTSASAWGAALGALGVSADREVVVCDASITPRATVVFWLLEHLGHRKVSMCADGLGAWEARGYKLTTTPTLIDAPESWLDVAIHPQVFVPMSDARRRLASPADAPIHAAFLRVWVVASDAVPLDLPSADFAHVPWRDNLTEAGRIKGAADLYDMYEAAGVTLFTEVIVAGESVEDASVAYFALRTLGFPMVRVYAPAGPMP